jgi:ribulose-bisphosphate carboxylase large chain
MRGYTALVLAKLARVMGASGIHVGTMGFGKMESEADDRSIAYMLERDVAKGLFYEQQWHGMAPTTPIISGGMNAVRSIKFYENLGHGNVILTAGGGSFGHLDGAAEGARSLRQAYECYVAGADALAYAKEHRQLARAFESFPEDADEFYPGWREALGAG